MLKIAIYLKCIYITLSQYTLIILLWSLITVPGIVVATKVLEIPIFVLLASPNPTFSCGMFIFLGYDG